jgi:hypothetical protein
MTRVLIEVSGGLVTNIIADGEVRVNVIDHDSLDPEDLPEDISEEVEIEDIREFQYPDEIRTPEALDVYIGDIIERYRSRENS